MALSTTLRGLVYTLHRALYDGRPVFFFLVLTGACQFGHGLGGFTTKFIHSGAAQLNRPPLRKRKKCGSKSVAEVRKKCGRSSEEVRRK